MNQLVYHLGDERLGRRSLKERVAASESNVRTQLEKMRQRDWVEMDRKGTFLTEHGRERFGSLLKGVIQVEPISLQELSLQTENRGGLIARPSSLKKNSWYYRDLAVQQGASGAVLVKRDGEELTFVNNSEPVGNRNPQDLKAIKDSLSLWQKSDYLVLVFAQNPQSAERGLWRILVEIVREGT